MIHTWVLDLKPNWFRGNNPEHNMKKDMFTTWDYQMLFIHNKPINHWYDIEVMGIMTKTCTIYAVTIYTSQQHIICQFMTLHTKPQVKHTL